ncbi:MAG: type II toxin-antitoxin system VapC family toxin [Thermomicrobiales bacterium]|nr:type II toxin-antitoxin system VapC family toxin [Thermomicrobiales bacterium]
MILLDTNVFSELMRAGPDPAVVAWLDREPRRTVWTTAVTVYEIRLGIDLLPAGRRKTLFDQSFKRILDEEIEHRVLHLDEHCADVAGELYARRKRLGFNVRLADTFIAGIAHVHAATIATRNVKDFRDLGARVVNPWDRDSTG